MLRELKARTKQMISCFKGKFKVTSPRGYRTLGGVKQYHGGLDLVGIEDINVYAIADGKVDATPFEANGFGYYIRQTLPDGRRIYYGHLKAQSICVKAGQSVKVGDRLGVMGSTGNSTGAHTHIELRPKGTSFESLDIAEFTGIPNKVGTYTSKKLEAIDCALSIQKKCGFEDKTMAYLSKYKFADDLFLKLWKAMN